MVYPSGRSITIEIGTKDSPWTHDMETHVTDTCDNVVSCIRDTKCYDGTEKERFSLPWGNQKALLRKLHWNWMDTVLVGNDHADDIFRQKEQCE